MESCEKQQNRGGVRPEARYAYYRRCQAYRRQGLQCKAPALKGEQVCYKHAQQRQAEARMEREVRAVIEEVVRQMRVEGRPKFASKDIFTDWKATQRMLWVVAQAVTNGKIGVDTARRLLTILG